MSEAGKTSLRLRKNLRLIALPVALGAVGAAALSILALDEDTWGWGIGVLCFAALSAGAQLFSEEHANQHMNWLMAQPIARARLLNEKLLALVLGVGLMFGAFMAVGVGYETGSYYLSAETHSYRLYDVQWREVQIPQQDYVANAKQRFGAVLGFPAAILYLSISRGFGDRMRLYHSADYASFNIDFFARSEELFLFFLALALCLGLGGVWMGMLLKQFFTAAGAAFVLLGITVLSWNFAGSMLQTEPSITVMPAVLVYGVVALVGARLSIRRLEV